MWSPLAAPLNAQRDVFFQRGHRISDYDRRPSVIQIHRACVILNHLIAAYPQDPGNIPHVNIKSLDLSGKLLLALTIPEKDRLLLVGVDDLAEVVLRTRLHFHSAIRTGVPERPAVAPHHRAPPRAPPGAAFLLGNSAEGAVDVLPSSGPGGPVAGSARVLPAHSSIEFSFGGVEMAAKKSLMAVELLSC
eukprot:CAMPEP_0172528774 /NCGR_PEP_ID=MMETSP1067-20121228/3049_1 /TAXON_ID=265564 ORGANISM="Thalassiosira punctigera, Strain Tpunct2005C2" /NCGR_SAMPLE_ID=MMETSP1067 /ASSEMBLY_ACC=CAM_ASM_000444 /LENGTH=189 /DNA_ID=CAMNT_0013312739 /DNA_START=111 /DNA_END=680 /DNA_ORIENTATION=+